MIPVDECRCYAPNYGSSAIYCDLPTEEQIRSGVVPLDSLPAAWWNAMWACTNQVANCANCDLNTVITEIDNVLSCAGICPNAACMDQLYQAINKIRQTIANSAVPGAVKSSSAASEVAIDACGVMTVNCLGNASSLTTSASTIVGAVNELKSTYDCCFSDMNTAVGGKAPTSHADSATTYGVGNASCYGHLKISDEYTCCVGAAAEGVAASQYALYCAYCTAMGAIGDAASLGNTAACPLGTASAGTCATAARSDHVHPVGATVRSYKHYCCANDGIAPDTYGLLYFCDSYTPNMVTAPSLIPDHTVACATAAGCPAYTIGAANCCWKAMYAECFYGTASYATCAVSASGAASSCCTRKMAQQASISKLGNKPNYSWYCVNCTTCCGCCLYFICNKSAAPIIATAAGVGYVIPSAGRIPATGGLCCACSAYVIGFDG